MGVRHKFRSPKSDDGLPAGAVKPSNWNDEHELDGLLGAFASLDVAANVLPYLDADALPALTSLTTAARAILACASYADALALLGGAAIVSPHLGGIPTAPTAALGTNTDQIATMAALQNAVNALIGGAPGALDTLAEFAAAINDDANIAATLTNALALRLRFDAAQSLTAPQLAQARANLALGTAAAIDVGTIAGKILQLDSNAKLPAVDGSQLLNIVAAWANITGKPTIGTAANNLVQLDGNAKLPVVDGSQLTNIRAALPGYYAGLPVSSPGGTATVTVGAGAAIDSTGSAVITFGGMTKTLSAFVAGNGNGAFESGSAPSNTFLYLFLIMTAAGDADLLLSQSPTAPTMPSGFTKFRRIGCVPTNASAQASAFSHVGDEFLWGAAVSEYNATPVNTASTLIPLFGLPQNIPLTAKFRFLAGGPATNGILFQSPDEAASVANSPAGNLQGSWIGNGQCSGDLAIRTSSRQIRCCTVASGANLSLVTVGFIDRRGRDLAA